MLHLVAATIVHSLGDFVTSLIIEDSEQEITTSLLMRWQTEFTTHYESGAFRFNGVIAVRILSFQRIAS